MTQPASSVLKPWMRAVLYVAAVNNFCAALGMLVFYHEGFKLLGLPRPQLLLPVQLVGVLVGLFGVGYWWVARNPLENRNLLRLGFWSKLLGSVLGIAYVVTGKMPPAFLGMLLVGDLIYLPPFVVIYQHLRRWPAQAAS